MDNLSRSLNVILEYLRAAEKFSPDAIGASNVMDLIIERRFSPHVNRELVYEKSHPVYSERDKELLMAIKDNYSLIFNLTSNRQKREEEEGLIYYKRIFWGSNSDNLSRYISDSYSDEVSRMASFLIRIVRKCPFIEVDFIIDYIDRKSTRLNSSH